ncbi:hypothetical protein KCU62_g446, partial [Aureobasidium sp. EXF-3399]
MCRRVDVDRDSIWMCVSQWLRLFSADQNREFRLSSFGCTAQHVKHSADGMLLSMQSGEAEGGESRVRVWRIGHAGEISRFKRLGGLRGCDCTFRGKRESETQDELNTTQECSVSGLLARAGTRVKDTITTPASKCVSKFEAFLLFAHGPRRRSSLQSSLFQVFDLVLGSGPFMLPLPPKDLLDAVWKLFHHLFLLSNLFPSSSHPLAPQPAPDIPFRLAATRASLSQPTSTLCSPSTLSPNLSRQPRR